MLNALIVDDEPLAHKVILHHLASHRDVKVVKQCHNAAEALAWLASNRADLIFLDINMPLLNGMDMLKVMANRPQVIIVSAYEEFALQGFELDVTDYLLKPVSEGRLASALEKVRQRSATNQPAQTPKEIVIKVDRELRRLRLSDITYLEAYGNYVKVWQGDTMLLASSTLKKLLAELPAQAFTQIHKSFVVRNNAVIGKDSGSVLLNNQVRLKVGKSFKSELNRLLPLPGQ